MPLLEGRSRNALVATSDEYWEQRHARFDKWVADVRDPAEQNSEGRRIMRCGRAAFEYELAPLPDGRYALRSSLDLVLVEGCGVPWDAFDSREEALEHALNSARRWFLIRVESLKKWQCPEVNRKSDLPDCKAMLDALSGLFFIEPEVTR